MSPTHSTAVELNTSLVSASRATTAVGWTLQLAAAAMFFMAGGRKLAGDPMMVQVFGTIGAGQWFRYVTGAIEVASAAGLLLPATAPFAALLLSATMGGAIATHLFIIGGSPAVAATLLLAVLAVAWIRRGQIARFIAA